MIILLIIDVGIFYASFLRFLSSIFHSTLTSLVKTVEENNYKLYVHRHQPSPERIAILQWVNVLATTRKSQTLSFASFKKDKCFEKLRNLLQN